MKIAHRHNVIGLPLWLRSALVALCTLAALASCDVHEFPPIPSTATAELHLRFSTDLPQFDYYVARATETREGVHVANTPVRTEGTMRYVVRCYPKGSEDKGNVGANYKEYIFTRNLAEGYDADFKIDIPPGDYSVKVWADMSSDASAMPHYYNVSNFYDVSLTSPHQGNTDYRDAFAGSANISLTVSEDETQPVEATVEMERPLAKFEFVSNDLQLFIRQQLQSLSQKAAAQSESTTEESDTRTLSLSMYRIVFFYNGYMPSSYNLFTDKPVDAVTGVSFKGEISQLSDDEASLGFDYVFVNHRAAEVTVQLAIYDSSGALISTCNPVNVPLQRSRHTIVRGAFLTQKAMGGINVNPAYDDEYNIRF